MTLKFAANLNFLFTEALTLTERINLAHKAGFRAVEISYPSNGEHIDEVIKAKNNTKIDVALINIATGDGDLKWGATSIPCAEEVFRNDLHKTIEFAKLLDCKKIHLMAGLLKNNRFEDSLETYIKNIRYAATKLEQEGIVGVIEPINNYTIPNYFLNSYETASKILRDINNTHLKLMVDIFHLQHIRGKVTHSLEEFKDIIGHIQIAQVPYRNEPDTAGELDYDYIFSLIEKSGYASWIGCEYKPKASTANGLTWISKYGYKL